MMVEVVGFESPTSSKVDGYTSLVVIEPVMDNQCGEVGVKDQGTVVVKINEGINPSLAIESPVDLGIAEIVDSKQSFEAKCMDSIKARNGTNGLTEVPVLKASHLDLGLGFGTIGNISSFTSTLAGHDSIHPKTKLK